MRNHTRALLFIDFLVVNAICAIVVALLFPVLPRARERSAMSACISNEMRIGKACLAYVEDNDGTFPLNRLAVTGGTWTWKRAIFPYVGSYERLKCPSVKNYFATNPQTGAKGDESNALPAYRSDKAQWLPASYGYSGGFFGDTTGGAIRARRLRDLTDPAETLLILNTRMSYPDFGPWMMSAYSDLDGNQSTSPKYGPFVTHGGRIPVILADGPVKSVKLIETVQPIDLWKSNLPGYQTQAELLAIARNMADEYK